MTPEERVAAAKEAIVHAARDWYVGRGNVEAPLAAAVVELQRAEREASMSQTIDISIFIDALQDQ